MLIIPAIDILRGKVVRLTRGSYDAVKVYSKDPAGVARSWQDKGAQYLHVVDLDGAKSGSPRNLNAVEKIIDRTDLKIELGGGIRDLDTVGKILKMGISKAVLGTKVIKDRNFAKECVETYGDKVIFGIDVRMDKVALEGWTEGACDSLDEYLDFFESLGLKRIIYTDIMKDGMMGGANIEGLKNVLKKTRMEVIASGGISDMDDIKKLKSLEADGLKGVIIGKALYEGKIKLEEAISAG